MKIAIMILLTTLSLFVSHYVWSACDGGGCGFSSCNPYESTCQCVDPGCSSPWDTDCISRGYCCEAFGNIGAR